jgi:hypothetical protein
VLAVVGVVLLVELASGIVGRPAPVRRQAAMYLIALVASAGAGIALPHVRGLGWRSRRGIGLVACLCAVLVIGLSYGIADRFLSQRYGNDRLSTWAAGVHDSKIAVVGFPLQYPLTGLDLSNRVEYLGRRGRHGAFTSLRTCREFLAAGHGRSYDYLVAGSQKWGLEPAPEIGWAGADRSLRPIAHSDSGDAVVFSVDGAGAGPDRACA